jgi:flagellin-like protein
MNKIAISKGVSPTIGVILIVALTVGLASMGSLIMFNSTDNPYEIPKGEVSTTDGNKLILVDKGDMERIYI